MMIGRTTTFLFTDLVGSTEILDHLGDEAAEALSRIHFGILRQAVSAHGGVEVKSLGDGIMVTFTSAVEAVAAAVAMQQAIDLHNRQESGPPLLERIGIHAGEPLTSDDDYFGSVVVIARRLCDHASGAQILASSTVRDLVGRRGDFAFLGLGDFEMKGLSERVQIYAVLWAKSERIRILLVEDEPLWAELLSHSLSHEARIEIVGSARDGQAAIILARELRANAVVMDIELAGEMDGIQAAIRIKEERPNTGIVILSAHRDRRYVTSLPLTKNPGWAYLLKQSVPDTATVLRAIEASMKGMMMLDPEVVASLEPRAASAIAALKPRELAVLRLIAQGFANGAIAERLQLGESSVEASTRAIYQQLGLSGESGISARVKAAVLFLDETRIAE